VPFLPFTFEEQMAIAHQLLLELRAQLSQAITMSSKQLVGNVRLQFAHETALCEKLVQYYDRDRGARSIAWAVEDKVKTALYRTYLEGGEGIRPNQPVEHYLLELSAEGSFVCIRQNGASSKISD
jgi:ATP-dependent Clp protease ATP-binding subunit ClpA